MILNRSLTYMTCHKSKEDFIDAADRVLIQWGPGESLSSKACRILSTQLLKVEDCVLT
jgi:hypothetical protein